jgi:hypothetical protein
MDDVKARGPCLALDLSVRERVGVTAKGAALNRNVIPRLEAPVGPADRRGGTRDPDEQRDDVASAARSDDERGLSGPDELGPPDRVPNPSGRSRCLPRDCEILPTIVACLL